MIQAQKLPVASAASGVDFGVVELPKFAGDRLALDVSKHVTVSYHASVEAAGWPAPRLCPVNNDSTSSAVRFSERDAKYADLYGALMLMRGLDDDEIMAIDEDTHRSACSVLNFLSYRRFPPPKVFAHGGDAVVFTWQAGETSIQLTVSDGIAALGYRIRGKGASTVGYVDLATTSVGDLFAPKVNIVGSDSI